VGRTCCRQRQGSLSGKVVNQPTHAICEVQRRWLRMVSQREQKHLAALTLSRHLKPSSVQDRLSLGASQISSSKQQEMTLDSSHEEQAARWCSRPTRVEGSTINCTSPRLGSYFFVTHFVICVFVYLIYHGELLYM